MIKEFLILWFETLIAGGAVCALGALATAIVWLFNPRAVGGGAFFFVAFVTIVAIGRWVL